MNNSTGSEMDNPPVHLTSDYVEIGYLALVLLVGTPINIFILTKLFRDRRLAQENSIKSSFLLLNINLNISDLLILLIVGFGKMLWIITYTWHGGDCLCKVYQLLNAFALYISSNIVVCIAIDRLRNVIAISKLRTGKAARTVTWMLYVSWVLAALSSIPQLFVWQTLNVYPDYPGGWIQCSDIWSIQHFRNTTEHSESTQKWYNITHLVLIFWGPLLILTISYVFIAVRLLHYSMKDPCRQNSDEELVKASTLPSRMLSQQNSLATSTTGSSKSALHPKGLTTPNIEMDYASEFQIHYSSGSLAEEANGKSDGLLVKKQKFNDTSECRLKRSKFAAKEASSYLKKLCCMDTSNEEKLERPTYQIRLTIAVPDRDESTMGPLLHPPYNRHQKQRSTGNLHRSNVPAWRRQLRSRVFRTTFLVVITHILFWFPYNLYAIMKYVNEDLYLQMSEHANIFKDLQLLITLINPFLYGFSS